jgi:metal-responsive CopG/Arc/MetJ family transcriptional regulator
MKHTRTKKLTIAVRADLLKFVDEYCKMHGLKNRSQVIEKAIVLLHEQELESDSEEAAGGNESLLDLPLTERPDDEDR